MTTQFPTNVEDVFKTRLLALDDVTDVIGRPLRQDDPSGAAGIHALTWAPEDHVIGQYDPQLSRYVFAVQCLIRHAVEELGRAEHSLLAKTIRNMLYRDPLLRVDLQGLSETSLGVMERLMKWGVRQQRYATNEVGGEFMYLSTTEVWVETESIPTP